MKQSSPLSNKNPHIIEDQLKCILDHKNIFHFKKPRFSAKRNAPKTH